MLKSKSEWEKLPRRTKKGTDAKYAESIMNSLVNGNTPVLKMPTSR